MVFGRKPHESLVWLRDVSFFDGFTDDELGRVSKLFHEVELPTGAVLVDQGDPGVDCFIIVEGTVSIYVRGELVATSGPGAVVGELALIDHRPRTATVIADSALKLLRFRTKEFARLLSDMPKANERVMSQLKARLDKT